MSIGEGRSGSWQPAILVLLSTQAVIGQGTPAGFYAASLVDQAEYRRVLDDELYTHYGDNRGNGPEHDLARANIVARFQSFELTTTLEPFTYQGHTYYNVVAELRGTTEPDAIYILGAHFDSVNNPGADDNASGVAGVLEIAPLASQWPAAKTVRFIAFDREEQGLIGSDAYVYAHRFDDIRGMISMDMLAYHPGPIPNARIYGRTASNSVKFGLANALANYAGITATVGGTQDASDHAPFEWEGFPAALLIEYDVWNNPYYHSQLDSVDTPNYINYAYAAHLTRGAMGWLVDVAGIQPSFPLGDMDGSYSVDLADHAPFVLALTDPAAYAAAYPQVDPQETGDFSGDGRFDADDAQGFVNLLLTP